MGQIRDIRQKN